MSDVALFAGDRYYRSQFQNGLSSYLVFLKDGITYADPLFPGGVPYSGSGAIQNAINALTTGTIYVKSGTYNISTTLQLKTGVYLRGENPGTTVLNGQTGIGKLLQTNVASPSSVNLDMKLEGFDLEQPGTEDSHVWVIGSDRFRMSDCLLGGGNAAKDAILIQDAATAGAFFNVFDNVQTRASLRSRSTYSFQGINPGPNWIFGGTGNVNAFGIDIQAGVQFVYGMELEQGPLINSASIPIKLAKGPTATFNPKLYFCGDFEPGPPTTAISLDANSLAVFIGNFSLVTSQISVAPGGIIQWQNVATTNSQSRQGFAITTPSVPATGVDAQNTNPFPVDIYITGTGSGITAYGVTDTAGTLQSFTTTVAVGWKIRIDAFGKIRLTYTGSPTWKWYGL